MSISNISNSLQQLQQMFGKADTDANGTLSKAEFLEGSKQVGGVTGQQGQTAETMFTQLDADADGQLSKAELTDGVELSTRVQEALLMAQEIMSGSTMLGIMNGSSKTDTSMSGIFNSGTPTPAGATATEDTATDTYTTMLQQIIAKYEAAEKEATAAAAEKAPTAVTA